jgi:hypothetical protein
MLVASAEIIKRAAAMLGTPADLLQDPLQLRRQIEQKLFCYLRMLPFRRDQYSLFRELRRTISLKSPGALLGLLCTEPCTLSGYHVETLFWDVYEKAGDQHTRRGLVKCLANGLRGQGNCQALYIAAGKMNDKHLVVWLLQHMANWTKPQVRDYGLTGAVKCGNMEVICLLLGVLGRYVLAKSSSICQQSAAVCFSSESER